MDIAMKSKDGVSTTITVDLDPASGFYIGDTITISHGGEESVCEILAVDGSMVTVSPAEDEFRREVRKITEDKDNLAAGSAVNKTRR